VGIHHGEYTVPGQDVHNHGYASYRIPKRLHSTHHQSCSFAYYRIPRGSDFLSPDMMKLGSLTLVQSTAHPLDHSQILLRDEDPQFQSGVSTPVKEGHSAQATAEMVRIENEASSAKQVKTLTTHSPTHSLTHSLSTTAQPKSWKQASHTISKSKTSFNIGKPHTQPIPVFSLNRPR
jgi:hypothetical protein